MYFYSCISTIKRFNENTYKLYSTVIQKVKSHKSYGQSKNKRNRVVDTQ